MIGHAPVALAILGGAMLAASNVPGLVVGDAMWHRVAVGESVVSIAARVGLEPATLAFDNDIRADRPLPAESWLLVDNRHIVPAPLDGVVVNVPQRMLHLALDGRHALSVPVAVGGPDWPTPRGSFAVAMKEVDPTWDVPPSIQAEMAREGRPVVTRVPPGPRNPLGLPLHDARVHSRAPRRHRAALSARRGRACLAARARRGFSSVVGDEKTIYAAWRTANTTTVAALDAAGGPPTWQQSFDSTPLADMFLSYGQGANTTRRSAAAGCSS